MPIFRKSSLSTSKLFQNGQLVDINTQIPDIWCSDSDLSFSCFSIFGISGFGTVDNGNKQNYLKKNRIKIFEKIYLNIWDILA